jgi:hypothetical protein
MGTFLARRRIPSYISPIVSRSPASLSTVRLLLQDIAAGIRVLQSRDGVPLSDEQILERARNIVTGLIGNYRITSRETSASRPARPIVQLDLLDALDRTAAEIGKDRPAQA